VTIPKRPNEETTDRLARVGASFAKRSYARRGAPISNDKIRVIIVDDFVMIREGLGLLLRAAPDLTIVGEADNGTSAVTLAQRVVPDVIVLDLDMPTSDGVSALCELSRTLPDSPVLVLTVHAERESLIPLLEAGARGYLTKDAASSELVEAIRVVAAGEIYVRPSAARLLAGAVVPQREPATAGGKYRSLSQREQTTLRLMAEGWSGVEIARQLGISTKTVDAYKHRIHDKLGLEHRTEYVRFAIEAGVLGGH